MFRHHVRQARPTHAERGFTLIELLIVIVVLGILAGIVVFGVSTMHGDAAGAACAADMKSVQLAAESYGADHDAFPGTIQPLLDGHYLKSAPSSPEYSIAYQGVGVVNPNGVNGFDDYVVIGTPLGTGTCPSLLYARP
jgi:general secretion pathway protein G